MIYGDSANTGLTEAQQKQANLRAKVFRRFDGAGVLTTDLYDFKGNSLRSSRQFVSDYRNAPDWSQNPALDGETFAGATAYDALNRAIAVTTPDNSVYRPTFNEANLLERVDVDLRGASPSTSFVSNIDYNAKGQRTLIQYGNGASTIYAHDEKSFRLTHLKTTRNLRGSGLVAQIFADPATVQDLSYLYDPIGNITRIRDAALLTVFNANQQVDPTLRLHLLILSTGSPTPRDERMSANRLFCSCPWTAIIGIFLLLGYRSSTILRPCAITPSTMIMIRSAILPRWCTRRGTAQQIGPASTPTTRSAFWSRPRRATG